MDLISYHNCTCPLALAISVAQTVMRLFTWPRDVEIFLKHVNINIFQQSRQMTALMTTQCTFEMSNCQWHGKITSTLTLSFFLGDPWRLNPAWLWTTSWRALRKRFEAFRSVQSLILLLCDMISEVFAFINQKQQNFECTVSCHVIDSWKLQKCTVTYCCCCTHLPALLKYLLKIVIVPLRCKDFSRRFAWSDLGLDGYYVTWPGGSIMTCNAQNVKTDACVLCFVCPLNILQ